MSDEALPLISRRSFEAAERGELIVPCPLISRGRPLYSSGQTALDEVPWMALQVGVGPAQVLVSWTAEHAGSGPAVAPLPSAYVIQTSANSTNGRDGDWRSELSIASNTASVRGHQVEFDGQSWLRLTFGGELGGCPPLSLDVHDATDGTDDCWLVLGDAGLAGFARAPSAAGAAAGWAETVHERYPGYFPALIDESRSDEAPARTLERLNELLATHSVARRVAIALKGPSSHGIEADVVALDAMVAAVLHGGRLPVLARSPAVPGSARDAVDSLHRAIAALESRCGLVPGPDLAAWFDAHPDQLDDEGRPSEEGRRAIARLWADAVDVWYVPQ